MKFRKRLLVLYGFLARYSRELPPIIINYIIMSSSYSVFNDAENFERIDGSAKEN